MNVQTCFMIIILFYLLLERLCVHNGRGLKLNFRRVVRVLKLIRQIIRGW